MPPRMEAIQDGVLGTFVFVTKFDNRNQFARFIKDDTICNTAIDNKYRAAPTITGPM